MSDIEAKIDLINEALTKLIDDINWIEGQLADIDQRLATLEQVLP